MSSHFLENTISPLPHLFVFKQQLRCCDEDSLAIYLDRVKEDLCQTALDEEWLKYWQAEGDRILADEWEVKYKAYMVGEQIVDNGENIPTSSEVEESIKEAIEPEVEGNVSNVESQSWDELWHTHTEQVYTECYNLYSPVYYNYITNLMKTLALSVEEESSSEEDAPKEIEILHVPPEELASLDLPTSFGEQSSRKYKKKEKQLQQQQVEDVAEESAETEDIVRCEDEAVLHETQNKAIEKKKRNRKLRNVPQFMVEEKGLLKYWRKRFSLFSRFDEGIKLDRESWFSVTPEKIAAHLAERLSCDVIVDGFCGCGGNAIQFARHCSKVIAIDIDDAKLAMAKHNAAIYGVADKIEFIHGDYMEVSKTLHGRADIAFLSPPWGGPTYKRKASYDIEKYLLPVGASELMEATRKISQKVAIFLPRNSNIQQVIKLAGVGKQCEVEHNYLDTRLVAITAFYGDVLAKNN